MGVDSDISRAEGPFSRGIIRDYTYLEQIDKEPAAFHGTVMDDISWRDGGLVAIYLHNLFDPFNIFYPRRKDLWRAFRVGGKSQLVRGSRGGFDRDVSFGGYLGGRVHMYHSHGADGQGANSHSSTPLSSNTGQGTVA